MRRPGSGFWILALFCLVVGCGYKTSPRPSAATVPGDIGLVEAHAYPDRVVLRWEVPRSNADGSLMTDLSGFKVLRLEEKIGEECENCPHEKKVRANVDFQTPTNAVVAGKDVTYTDSEVTPGNVYTYAVVAYNLKGRQGPPSPDATVYLDEPPPAPEGLRVDYSPTGVVLEWTSPTRPAGIKSYRIYRSDSDKPEEMKPVGGTKWAETFFKDETAEKERSYYYEVRSLKMSRGVPLESAPTQMVKAVVPATSWPPPENINTLAAADGIRVYWDAAKIPGHATRYNVYRSESGKMFAKVNTKPLDAPSYIDKDVRTGRTYRYAVTCWPEGKPEEESSRTASEAVEFRP